MPRVKIERGGMLVDGEPIESLDEDTLRELLTELEDELSELRQAKAAVKHRLAGMR